MLTDSQISLDEKKVGVGRQPLTLSVELRKLGVL